MNENTNADILRRSEALAAEAEALVQRCAVVTAWESAGAEIHRVGSSAMGLMMKHRDVDFHLYTETLDSAVGFRVLGKIAETGLVTRAVFNDLSRTVEECFEWHIWIRDPSDPGVSSIPNALWQIDMIQIRRSSAYDGYFERVAERIRAILTPKTKFAILSLKDLTPPDDTIPGILYYQAVLRDGVRTWDEFSAWRKSHPTDGVIEWMP